MSIDHDEIRRQVIDAGTNAEAQAQKGQIFVNPIRKGFGLLVEHQHLFTAGEQATFLRQTAKALARVHHVTPGVHRDPFALFKVIVAQLNQVGEKQDIDEVVDFVKTNLPKRDRVNSPVSKESRLKRFNELLRVLGRDPISEQDYQRIKFKPKNPRKEPWIRSTPSRFRPF